MQFHLTTLRLWIFGIQCCVVLTRGCLRPKVELHWMFHCKMMAFELHRVFHCKMMALQLHISDISRNKKINFTWTNIRVQVD